MLVTSSILSTTTICIPNEHLERGDETNFLRTTVDSKLSFEGHVDIYVYCSEFVFGFIRK